MLLERMIDTIKLQTLSPDLIPTPDLPMPIDPDFLKLLGCPACENCPPVELDEEHEELVCTRCGKRYPIVEDIPVMLVEEAREPRS